MRQHGPDRVMVPPSRPAHAGQPRLADEDTESRPVPAPRTGSGGRHHGVCAAGRVSITGRWSYVISPRRCSVSSAERGRNAAFSTGSESYGLHEPHMKMSTAAKSRSGQVWIEMWLSASTSTPLTP